jgi:hypothetical protein
VTVVLVLLVNRAALRSADAPPTPTPSASIPAPGQRTGLPPVRVAAPPPSAGATRYCPRLLGMLPLTLAGLAARPVDPPSPNVAAWGEPPVVLRCGVPRPVGFVVGAQTFILNRVTWYAEQRGPQTMWTAVDRPVYLEVAVPTGYAGGPVAELSTLVARTLQAQPIRPGR